MPQGTWVMSALCYKKEGSHMKSRTVWFHFYDKSRIAETIKTEGLFVFASGWGERQIPKMPVLSLWVIKIMLSGDGRTALRIKTNDCVRTGEWLTCQQWPPPWTLFPGPSLGPHIPSLSLAPLLGAAHNSRGFLPLKHGPYHSEPVRDTDFLSSDHPPWIHFSRSLPMDRTFSAYCWPQ